MNRQHHILLSIGTNQGNRLENIEQCISKIHQEVGTVVAVSSIYESDSWGFESDSFLNCALLLHTHKGAHKVLKGLLKIESDLGRTRSQKEGYESRIIDIDIIAFDDEQIENPKLTLPHPHYQERLFVLLPMKEIAPDWVCPLAKKTIAELLTMCQDKGRCVVKYHIEAPLQKLRFDHVNYIAIEGNIGAGKTTLVGKMAEDFNAKKVLERFADNPFLPKFYKDQNRYAFPLEMSFLADRYQQISDDLAQFDLFKDFVVADYHIFKSLIFAKVTLGEDEFRLYKTLFDIIYKEMPKPDLYVYLYQNTERLLQNIKKRGRVYEQEIPAEYLEKINNGYLDYIKTQQGLDVLIIDVSTRDFVKNQEDYVFVLDEIQKRITAF
ncbi:2-amino-4-hydroxy-6-hydroxymethyldihydropteridine diphosphokinase [Flavobacterium aciduliphilum]|uniref:2-amino-4-hydroxy-6-hydroxymethyldihydropteridine pyrophosphokinase n=1 Tax=Flavobacterium aciduliphilum TaxID=1101402 RepID=A0A328YCS7_9FLAO|nr:2-amino-4-hydroxy-6-hydroxymethyldihydropteridine diphosphokinase [Flavobacterium aciduliphilum]RAR71808.1 2-amino-4-hydroxy-6-hydroxymethyldihydropteridine diphosphokinase [Flavobacterium aciduliphilum]